MADAGAEVRAGRQDGLAWEAGHDYSRLVAVLEGYARYWRVWQMVTSGGLYAQPAGVAIMHRMNRHGIVIEEQRIADFCRGHGIRNLRLFGSILRGDFGPDSDVDVLVEFAPGRAPGWIGFAALALELERIIGREVDLRTVADFSESVRRRVLSEAEVQYAA